MNYQRPELHEPLAAAYALGSMRARARARFERVCASLPTAQAARMRWEDRLLPLALAGPEVQPSAASWTAIARRLADDDSATGPQRRRMTSRRWLAVASVAVVALMIGTFTLRQPPQWQLVANLAPANAAIQWRVQRSADTQRITIQSLQAVSHAPATSFELWVLPVDGSKPVSLGVMPESGSLVRTLTEQQRRLLLTAANVAVTVEPAGGSPTGLPSGPPIIVAPISRIT
jgi:anti-sigma-K factor RskA